jgi:hypothetical protein
LKEADTELCGAPGADWLDKRNKAKFCQAMNNGSMYPGANADFISTYNPDNWRETTGYQPSETTCESGGTSTNCFSAVCYEGGPSSPYLQGVSSPAFNATCYCPYYVFDSSMSVWNATDDPCGPKQQGEIQEGTIIYNGLWLFGTVLYIWLPITTILLILILKTILQLHKEKANHNT